jgi:hypothetical protein
MGINEIASSDYGNIAGTETTYSINPLDTDGSTGTKETYYTPDFAKWMGIYKKVAVIKTIIDKKAMWTIGKGYNADENTKKILGRIKGFGKDTFNSIMFNAVTTHEAVGDFYAEIIRDKAGRLTNLKPLNSGSMRNVANEFGILIRFEQISRNPITKKVDVDKIYELDKIFYLPKDRIADEIHGTSTLERMESIILKYSKSIDNGQKLQDRNVVPIHIFKLDTDDPVKVAEFKAKADAAVIQGENLYIPMNAVENETLKIGNIIDPLPWIRELENILIISAGVPLEIIGGSNLATDGTSKIKYLAYQQMIEWNQLFLEDQIKMQLGLEVEFEFPASIDPTDAENKPNVTSPMDSNKKDGNTLNKMGVDPTSKKK